MKSSSAILTLIVACHSVVTMATDEKREMPNQYSYSVYRTGDSGINGAYASVSSSNTDRNGQLPPFNVAFGPAAPTVGTYGGGPVGLANGGGAGGPPYSPYNFKDPGFSVQTGFEGFLVPNPWYSAISWGIEGLVVAGIAIVFILGLKAGLIFLLFKFFRIGKLFKDDDSSSDDAGSAGRSSYIPSVFNQENLTRLTSTVMSAIDSYNDMVKDEDH